MYTLSSSKLKNSLEYGSQKGFCLMGEVFDRRNYQRIKVHPFIKDYYEEIKKYAETISHKKLPELGFQLFKRFSIDGNRLSYEKEYFERWKMLFALTAVTITDETDIYIPQIEDFLWDFCDQYTWALPAHLPVSLEEMKKSSWPCEEYVDLFASETAFSLAEILYLIRDRLDPVVTDRVESEIERRVIRPFMGSNMFWWETTDMNWASVCAGSVGCAAIYLIKDDERLTLILQRVIGALNSYLEGFGEDGATPEGLGYWRYGFGYYVFFAKLLSERTLGSIDLFYTKTENNKIRRIAQFPSALQLSKGVTVNFSDSLEEFKPTIGIFKCLENIFGNLGFDYSECSTFGEDNTNKWTYLIRDLFWGIDSTAENNDSSISGLYFSSVQWLIRKSEARGKMIVFAAKGGSNNEPHNHNDLGHFIIHYKGCNLLSDIGSPEYVKEFFRDETRYNFFNASSLSHSVPQICGKLQRAGDLAKAAVMEIVNEKEGHFLIDLTTAYDVENLNSFTRNFIWNFNTLDSEDQPFLHIRDNFKFETGENSIVEAFITRYRPEFLENGKIKISNADAGIILKFDEGKFICSVEEHEYSDHYGIQRKAFRIVLKLLGNATDITSDIYFKLI